MGGWVGELGRAQEFLLRNCAQHAAHNVGAGGYLAVADEQLLFQRAPPPLRSPRPARGQHGRGVNGEGDAGKGRLSPASARREDA